MVPSDEELEACKTTLEWLVENTKVIEPHATHTINIWEEAAQTIPTEEELEDHE